ncbi:hypothetical protein N6H14_29340 [Paenibacillus sp. CC-CFT747]|nr:hypothetical protein N6H14_29340 [Paenibacillus sp. CC-CFT747]
MIGNAHLDPVWLWPWQEGFQETKATFRSALDRMKECDDFLFTSSSAASYEWVENNDPAMFQEIKERIAEGRWQIVGGGGSSRTATCRAGNRSSVRACMGSVISRRSSGSRRRSATTWTASGILV